MRRDHFGQNHESNHNSCKGNMPPVFPELDTNLFHKEILDSLQVQHFTVPGNSFQRKHLAHLGSPFSDISHTWVWKVKGFFCLLFFCSSFSQKPLLNPINMALTLNSWGFETKMLKIWIKTIDFLGWGFKWKNHIVLEPQKAQNTNNDHVPDAFYYCYRLTHASLAIAQVGRNDHSPLLSNTHLSETHIHSQHNLSRS